MKSGGFCLLLTFICVNAAFAADVDLSAGTSRVLSAKVIEVRGIQIGGIDDAILRLKWDPVANVFKVVELEGAGSKTHSPMEGKWTFAFDNACQGDYNALQEFEFGENGACKDPSSAACTWTYASDVFKLSWSVAGWGMEGGFSPDGTVTGKVINPSNENRCFKATRLTPRLENNQNTNAKIEAVKTEVVK